MLCVGPIIKVGVSFDNTKIVNKKGAQNKRREQTQKQTFPGIVRDFLGIFVYMFFLPHKESPDSPPKNT